MELEKLICSKCGEEFPATTERGPGPAKAKFAAHVNKCEGKKRRTRLTGQAVTALAPQQVEALEEGEPAPTILEEAAADQPRNVKTITITQNLKCILTPAETLARAKEMSRANSEIIRLEADLKSVKSQYNSQIDKHTATRDDMSRRVSEGCEGRDVECTEYWDYDRHEVYVVRRDTFETVSSRTMSNVERQRGLDFPEESEGGAGQEEGA